MLLGGGGGGERERGRQRGERERVYVPLICGYKHKNKENRLV